MYIRVSLRVAQITLWALKDPSYHLNYQVMANTRLLTQLSLGNVYHSSLIVFLKKFKIF